jgi:hypothetical protein
MKINVFVNIWMLIWKNPYGVGLNVTLRDSMLWKYKITGHMEAKDEEDVKSLCYDFECHIDNSKHFHVTVEPFINRAPKLHHGCAAISDDALIPSRGYALVAGFFRPRRGVVQIESLAVLFFQKQRAVQVV